MHRIRITAYMIVAVAAIAGLLVNAIAASGEDDSKRLRLFEHQTEFGIDAASPTALTVGNSFGISSDLFTGSDMKTKVGHAGVACVVSSVARATGPEGECSLSAVLAGGQISATGLVSFADATTPGASFSIAIVGGTGRYRNAHGQLDVNVINPTDSWDTFKLS